MAHFDFRSSLKLKKKKITKSELAQKKSPKKHPVDKYTKECITIALFYCKLAQINRIKKYLFVKR